MEHCTSYVGCEISKVPLSDIAQRIMSALRSIPVAEAQTSRKNDRSEAVPVNKTFHGQETKTAGSSLSQSALSAPVHYQDPGLPKWVHRERNFSVEAKKVKNGEENVATSLKRKQDACTSCSEKTRKFLVKNSLPSYEGRYNWASGKAESSENCPRDITSLRYEEKRELIATIKQAGAFVTTMVFQDGSSLLNSEQVLTSSVKGIVVLVKRQTNCLCSPSNSSTAYTWDASNQNDKLLYLKMECSSVWKQEETHKKYVGQILFQMLHCKVPVICFNAKDFLRTNGNILIKTKIIFIFFVVADSVILDPRIAAWLINPSDTVPSFECLIQKYFEKSFSMKKVNTDTGSLRNVQGLWKLFCTLELPLIKILAGMKLRLKELEQEAHQVAGEQFLVTSSAQLREVLFEKLKLHTLCEKIPKTEIQQVESTSEAVLNKLQDLHPLPKIILEYRQVHKIKSTYVDGLLTCMKKGFISSTWNQTGTATGRLSAKHPNIQAISKHPVRIKKKQYVKGKEEEIITISPRTFFVSNTGYTFLAADFSHIELRILADLTSDPELLKLFQEPETTDIFATLASQCKNNLIYYYVVVVKGYVVSIMGRKRPLANINAQDYKLRTQAERQAVNFVVQGSAADLCKMAMVEIFTSVVISPTLTARLIAQIHDELLFEVEDSQIQEFSGSLGIATGHLGCWCFLHSYLELCRPQKGFLLSINAVCGAPIVLCLLYV
uniref:DNA-directed DNA polymerase n=1 Tax=Nothoprocta perdicaria TaxID=30464 RepID=A0A8C6YR85_NOTPE